MQNYQNVKQMADRLRTIFAKDKYAPQIALVLGTGLSNAVNNIYDKPLLGSLPFSALPNFPAASIPSHAGKFVWGFINKIPVISQVGRIHLYEHKTPEEISLGVRIMRELGAEILLITNAAGALNPLFKPASLMGIADHINFTGLSPLMGKNEERWGERFPDMSMVYDRNLLNIAQECSLAHKIRMEEGIYIGVHGPEMETPAETRMFRQWGADAIGMSTVLEVIAAKHLGMKILGISCITNINLPDCMAPAPLEEILAIAKIACSKLEQILPLCIKKIGEA